MYYKSMSPFYGSSNINMVVIFGGVVLLSIAAVLISKRLKQRHNVNPK